MMRQVLSEPEFKVADGEINTFCVLCVLGTVSDSDKMKAGLELF